MMPYRDLMGGSAILGYREAPGEISVTFAGGKTYRYTHASAGKTHVEAMKAAARSGEGLHRYVQRHQPQHEE